ncbi:hypothetical protein SLEP1_g42169 [Rubroshorea leprosula]|uniref:Uncharacterized protein n=1 Tax=Rubroshorea leprosula TaxID=152421 RepID=A0AAV5L920_9ROSI|nr:hypothetical protein SLEP1_g42169 [Rubroshorea leprosula]
MEVVAEEAEGERTADMGISCGAQRGGQEAINWFGGMWWLRDGLFAANLDGLEGGRAVADDCPDPFGNDECSVAAVTNGLDWLCFWNF